MGQMMPRPDLELERLVAVRSVVAFKNAETAELKAISQLAQGVFGVARAAVHILDEDWLHIAEQAGLQFQECPRDIAICDRVVVTQNILTVTDLSAHPEFGSLPYVKGAPDLRSYAGAPIELEPGLVVGTFCLLDPHVREYTAAEVDNLQYFATLAGALLRLQKANFTMSLAARELRDAAMTDPLTGFYNRKALDAIVDLELGAALCEKDTFSTASRPSMTRLAMRQETGCWSRHPPESAML